MKLLSQIFGLILILVSSVHGDANAKGFTAFVSNGELRLVIKGVDGLEARDYGELAPITLYIEDGTRKGFLKVYEEELAKIFLFSRSPIKYKAIIGNVIEFRIPIKSLKPRGFFDLESGELIGFSEPRHKDISRYLDGDLKAVELLGKTRKGTLFYRLESSTQ